MPVVTTNSLPHGHLAEVNRGHWTQLVMLRRGRRPVAELQPNVGPSVAACSCRSRMFHMSPEVMNATLALLTPDEIGNTLRFFEICERGGTPPEEADEWRRRILAWQAFVELDRDQPTS